MLPAVNNFFYKLTHWESWHFHAKYIPILPAWLWYCIRSRSLWFFTSSNPTLTFGGMDGETKEEMYTQLPAGSYPNTVYITPSLSIEEVEDKIKLAGIVYPFAVKPNVGMSGFMFRKIETREILQFYHSKISVDYLIQDLISLPLEVSVFYYRLPNESKGTVSGFVKKGSPFVVGDGKSTLSHLIQSYPGVRFTLEKVLAQHDKNLNSIIPKGEKYQLSDASNRGQGGKIENLRDEIDDSLVHFFDKLSHYSGQFFYGRYDIKCASIEDLKQEKNYSILEFNGSGSGTQHIYGSGYNLFQAWKIILTHWKMLYKISRYNNNQGIKYWKFWRGLKFLGEAKRNLKTLKQLDAEFPAL